MADRPIDRALRIAEQRGLNQTGFADLIGESPQTVHNWTKRGLPADKLEPVANKLNCSVDALLGRSVETWLLDYYGLNDDEQTQIREIIEDRIARFRAKQSARRGGTKISRR